jgi:hypothetical protein
MRVRRLDVVDEYAEGGQVALYSQRGFVVVLSDLASAAWWALGADWVDLDTVAASLVEQFGAPPDTGDAGEATEEALLVLAGHGLVELDDGA